MTATEPTATIRTEPTAAPAEGRFPHLAKLVGDDRLGDFLAERLGKDSFRRRLPAGAALFGWARLNAALAEHRFSPPRLRLERSGGDYAKGLFKERRTRRGDLLHDLDPEVLNARLREGATLILDAANELDPELQALCAGLAAEFVCACQANLYACWGGVQGFDVHWDDHDVFVVQVEGAKRWSLYGSTLTAPTRRLRQLDHERPEEPIEEIVLEPGDMLYLPRGYWHAAVGMGAPTLHLTIGLTRKSGGDLLHWLADQSSHHEVARADLPLEADDETLGHRVAELMAAMLADADPVELGRRYRRKVEAGQGRRPMLSFPYIGDSAAPYASDTSVRFAPGIVRVSPSPRAGAVVLRHRGTDYTVVAALENVLAEMAAGEPTTFGDLQRAVGPGDADLVAAFVSDMIARGVFLVTET